MVYCCIYPIWACAKVLAVKALAKFTPTISKQICDDWLGVYIPDTWPVLVTPLKFMFRVENGESWSVWNTYLSDDSVCALNARLLFVVFWIVNWSVWLAVLIVLITCSPCIK